MIAANFALSNVGYTDVSAYPPPTTPTVVVFPTMMPPDDGGNVWYVRYNEPGYQPVFSPLGALVAVCHTCATYPPAQYQTFVAKFTFWDTINGWNQIYGTYAGITMDNYPWYMFNIPIMYANIQGCLTIGAPQSGYMYEGTVPRASLTWLGGASPKRCVGTIPIIIK